jgi:hypothetical protein
MSPTQGTPENVDSGAADRSAARSRVVTAVDANDIMMDQLEFLIEHVQAGVCGCEQCERYWRARAVLMDVFADSPRAAAVKKTSSSTA